MNIGIIGSREFKHLEKVHAYLLTIKNSNCDLSGITIISGGAKGVDWEAIRFANKLGFHIKEIIPDFSSGYDVMQYHLRNDKIIEQSDKIVAFWDGSSRGTKSVIDKCLQRRKNIEVIFD